MRTLSQPFVLGSLFALFAGVPAVAQEPVDDDAVAVLRKHGLEQSKVMDHLSWICDVHGPRLTGSPNLRRAQRWAVGTFESWGLVNVHLDEWGPFGRGWELEHFEVAVVGENPWQVHAFPKAWSPSLGGRVEVDVVMVADITADELRAMDLNDKVVLIDTPRTIEEAFDGTARRLAPEDLLALADSAGSSGDRRRRARPASFRQGFARRAAMMQIVYDKQPLAILDRGYKGSYGTIFVSSASMSSPPDVPRSERPRPWRPNGQAVIPQFTLAVEHYNRICRLLEKGVQVRLALELKSTYHDDNPMQHNVIAEIPGTDPVIGEEIVMLGAHFDSWHSGTGATDNGAGSAVMIEAIRLVKQLIDESGKQPRRTIRIALWSGEEQGLLGSRAYVRKQLAESGGQDGDGLQKKGDYAKLSGYYNLDNGTGRVRGVYLQGNAAVAPIFRAWLKPFGDLNASTLTLDNTGGTDHLAFDRVGLPGFQFIQDPVAYSPQTHHSNMDNWDHAVPEDLQQAATIIASFVWHTAQRDQQLPRK